MAKKKTLRVNTMYGADGRLRTSYFEGEAAKVAQKNAKAFNKELERYEKDFAAYASLDIESAMISDLNTQYVYDKMGIAEQYIDYVPEGDAADIMGDEMTAIAGNKHSQKLGIGAKLAGKFQPFFAKQAEKYPSLQKISDRITRAANNGRMPLTADSAAMMRIAFDKKYYNDCRRPGADLVSLREQHKASVENLTKMAMYDGIEMTELSAKFSEKLMNQMQVDDSLTDIYHGMADGSVRLANVKPMMNAKGEVIRVGGKTLFERSSGFVKAEKDDKGRNIEFDAWGFETREPQSVDEILADYQSKLDRYAESCKSEGDFKRMLSSESYKNLERNAKTFAEADCPDEADKFKYEFMRKNLESCKKWAIEHNHRSPYASLVIPQPWEERVAGNDFVRSYATDDYYDINEKTEIHDDAVKAVENMTDTELANDLACDFVNQTDKLDSLNERLNRLEAENAALREKLAQVEQERATVDLQKHEPENNVKTAEQGSAAKPSFKDKALSAARTVSSVASFAMDLKREIQEQYNSKDDTILDVNSKESTEIQSEQPLAIEHTDVSQSVIETHSEPKYYLASQAVTLRYSYDVPVEYDENGADITVPAHTETNSMVVPGLCVLKTDGNRVVELPYSDADYYSVRENESVRFDALTDEQLADLKEISKEQYDTLMQYELQIENERAEYTQKMQELEMESLSGEGRSQAEIQKDISELTLHGVPSHDAYMDALEKVLDTIPVDVKDAAQNEAAEETIADNPKLVGTVEKYGLPIDFNKISSVDIVTKTNMYIGGIDDEGHERKDNYQESTETISYWASDDKKHLVRTNSNLEMWSDAKDMNEVLDHISESLDRSMNSDKVSVYINRSDGTKELLDAQKLLDLKAECGKGMGHETHQKVRNASRYDMAAADASVETKKSDDFELE